MRFGRNSGHFLRKKVMMKLFFSSAALCLFFAALALPSCAAAQTGTLHGTVQDPSGAVVPSASISLTGGAQPLQTKSGADGQYTFRSVAPGTYTVSVTAR